MLNPRAAAEAFFERGRRNTARRGTITTNTKDGDIRQTVAGGGFADREIPLKDKILLGPIDKYRKYNRFPWKYLIHIMMIIMSTIQVFFVTNFYSSYAYNSRE